MPDEIDDNDDFTPDTLGDIFDGGVKDEDETDSPGGDTAPEEDKEEENPDPEKDKEDEGAKEEDPKESEKEKALRIELESTKAKLDRTSKWGNSKSSEVGQLKRKLGELEAEKAGEEYEESDEVKAEKAQSARMDYFKNAEELVKPLYNDYDAVVGDLDTGEDTPLIRALQKDAGLVTRIFGAKNPALEAYTIGKERLDAEKYGETPEEMRAKIREEILAENAAAKDKEGDKNESTSSPKKNKTPTPPTLRDVQGSTKTTDPDKVVGESLEDIFDR